MNGILKSKGYEQKDKDCLAISIGDNPTIESIISATGQVKMLESDVAEITKFAKYLSTMYAYSCVRVKGKINVKGKTSENQSISRFAAEGFALAKGNVRNMYFGAIVDSMVNSDRDEILDRIKQFDPSKRESIEWLASLKMPAGSPAMAMFSSCVTKDGFRFPVETLPIVPVNKNVANAAMNEHWILKVCPLGFGTVQMIVAASLYKGGTDGIC